MISIRECPCCSGSQLFIHINPEDNFIEDSEENTAGR